jgi:hypothetical protein
MSTDIKNPGVSFGSMATTSVVPSTKPPSGLS